MQQRVRYVLVEAQIQPKLLGGRVGAGDLSEQKSADLEIARGLRMRLAPQGITGTSYLEIDYVEPVPPVLAIDWAPTTIYIPSAPSTVTTVVNAAIDILTRLHNLDIEKTLANLDRLLVTTNARVEAIDTKTISQRADRVLAKMETALDELKTRHLPTRVPRSSPSFARPRPAGRRWKPGVAELPDDTAAAVARVRHPRRPQRHGIARASVADAHPDRPDFVAAKRISPSLSRICARSPTTCAISPEDSKRYPANVIFGEPPKPPERIR
jgi:hypothetical protein